MKAKKYKELILLLFLSLILNFSTINNYPVLDRDEARYAQSTKQMLESKNYKSIKFQEDLRSKKPIGIYWLQAVSVNIFSLKALDKDTFRKYNKIWKYRFISCLFSLFSCIALYLIASKVFSKKIAFTASIILNCTLLFIVESHIAKTDSVLLTFSVISMIILCGYYKGIFKKQYDSYFFLFWLSLGFSTLIKGPIIVLMVVITIIFIFIFKRRVKWFIDSNPLVGFFIIIIIVTPWFLSIPATEQSSFLNQGLKKDLLDKILGVQESHGAFFGAHTLSILLLFFPMSLFLLPGISTIIKEPRSDNNFFLLAWIIPNLFILELIPTKLPHYTLPLYPALSLLAATYIASKVNYKKKFNTEIIASNVLFVILFTVLIVFFLSSIKQFSSVIKNYNLIILLVFFLYLIAIFINIRIDKIKSFYYQIFLACITSFFIFGFLLPKLDKIWVSNSIYETIKKDNSNFDSDSIAVVGYNEPSLVFMLGTKINILFSLQEDFFEKKLYKYIIVEKRYLNDFNNILKNKKYQYILLKDFNGFNMAKNKWVNTLVFKLK